MTLSNEDVREIIQVLDDLDATELHLRTRSYSLSLRRDGGGWTQASEVLSAPRLSDPVPPPVALAAPVPEDDDAGLVAVRAPMMGTFYRAPRPGAPPFVEVGDRVEEDTVVGIVETMKLMSSVPAGTRGRVARICLDDGAYAEQGAVLVRIAPG